MGRGVGTETRQAIATVPSFILRRMAQPIWTHSWRAYGRCLHTAALLSCGRKRSGQMTEALVTNRARAEPIAKRVDLLLLESPIPELTGALGFSTWAGRELTIHDSPLFLTLTVLFWTPKPRTTRLGRTFSGLTAWTWTCPCGSRTSAGAPRISTFALHLEGLTGLTLDRESLLRERTATWKSSTPTDARRAGAGRSGRRFQLITPVG